MLLCVWDISYCGIIGVASYVGPTVSKEHIESEAFGV
jgi:hypothetical protein